MSATKGLILRGLQDSLNAMHQAGGELTIHQMRVLLFVMRRDKVTGSDIMAALDLSRPTTSRIVAALSNEMIGRRNAAPLDLVRFEDDPMDRRVRYIVLTEKGQTLASKLEDYFQL